MNAWRDAFHVPGPGPYALSHSVGCLPYRALAALHETYLQPWETAGGDAWPQWLTVIDRYCEALAGLLGGNARAYCPQVNLSSALTKLLGALPPPAPDRNVLLASEDCFPSLAYVLARAGHAGFRCRLLPRTIDPADVADWRDALEDAGVYGALVTHVHSNSGAVAPIEAVADACRARGILCIVDVAQSAGVLPIDVDRLGADVVLGSCVKWLCGGPGAGFMWIRAGLWESLQPVDVGWFSHARPFDGDPRVFEYAPDARRFWGGTPSIAPYALAAASVGQIAAIGIDRIQAHNLALKRALLAGLPGELHPLPDPARTGGTVCLPLGGHCQAVTSALRRAGVRFDVRGRTARLSFHVYNTPADVSLVLEAIDAAIATGGQRLD